MIKHATLNNGKLYALTAGCHKGIYWINSYFTTYAQHGILIFPYRDKIFLFLFRNSQTVLNL